MLDAHKKLIRTIVKSDDFSAILRPENQPPFVTIYLPLTHAEREMRRDEKVRIEFKDLTKKAVAALEEKKVDTDTIEKIKTHMQFMEETEDLPMWLNTSAALGIFISTDGVKVFTLNDATPEPVVVVGDRYYIKPLVFDAQGNSDYYILTLGTDRFGVLKGDQDGVQRIDLPEEAMEEIMNTYPDLFGTEAVLDNQTPEGHFKPYHLWRSRNDVVEHEADRFWRVLNKALNDYVFKNDPTPVIIAATPEDQAGFRNICTIPTVVGEAIEKDPESMDGKALTEAANALFHEAFKQEIHQLLDAYQYEASQKRGSTSLEDIALALVERKVDTLMVQRGVDVAGYFDEDGKVTFLNDEKMAEPTKIPVCDPQILDLMVHKALEQDAYVYVLYKEHMPAEAGAAAIYRY